MCQLESCPEVTTIKKTGKKERDLRNYIANSETLDEFTLSSTITPNISSNRSIYMLCHSYVQWLQRHFYINDLISTALKINILWYFIFYNWSILRVFFSQKWKIHSKIKKRCYKNNYFSTKSNNNNTKKERKKAQKLEKILWLKFPFS